MGYAGFEYLGLYRGQKELAQQWQQQQQRAAEDPASAASSKAGDDGLTRITSAKIDLDAIVVEGISHRQLNLGPGHLPETPEPGEAGNSVISAHRDMFFRHIYELGKGDEIVVQRNGRAFKFAVTGKKIVMPDDVSVLRPTPQPTLTLITCYPIYYIGPAPKRLIVTAELVGKDEAPASTANATSP
jgi:sortase A